MQNLQALNFVKCHDFDLRQEWFLEILTSIRTVLVFVAFDSYGRNFVWLLQNGKKLCFGSYKVVDT